MISYVPTIKGGFGRPFFVFALLGSRWAASSLLQQPDTSDK